MKITDKLKNIFLMNKEEAKSTEILKAKIIIKTLSYNNMHQIQDENGEWQKAPVPDPVEEEAVVKKGDQIKGFEVFDLTANFIVLNSLMEYTEDKASAPKNQFTIEKGECINLNMSGVYDEVNRTSIEYVEAVDEVECNKNRRDEYIVTKNDWEISPMPEKTCQFKIKRKFSEEAIKRLRKGHLPEDMEDRWFYYYEDGKMYYHRSWSGNCIFIVEFNFKSNKHIVTVNRDENQYANTDIDEDIELINELLN